MRTAQISRTTKETDIQVEINLDGTGQTDIQTGVAFFDHMLDAFGRHGLFDLNVRCKGDIEVDAHHTVEDCGIVLGQAIAQALGDKRGITRYASLALPMDETLVLAAVDISGRGAAYVDLDILAQKVGDFDTELGAEFFIALAANAGITLHVRQLAGGKDGIKIGIQEAHGYFSSLEAAVPPCSATRRAQLSVSEQTNMRVPASSMMISSR